MYYLHCFIAFSARSDSISLDICIKYSFRKNKTYLFQSHVALSCTTIHDYNQVHMKAEKICYKMVITN